MSKMHRKTRKNREWTTQDEWNEFYYYFATSSSERR